MFGERLHRKCKAGNQVVVPLHKRLTVISEFHDAPHAGHQGQKRRFEMALSRYFWPYMHRDFIEYIRGCEICQRRKPLYRGPGPVKRLVKQYREAILPFTVINLDLMHFQRKTTRRKIKFIILARDLTTWFVVAKAVPNATSATVAKFIMEQVFAQHGAPRVLITDNGSNLRSEIMKKVMMDLESKHKFTAIYHPEAKGSA